MFGKNFAGGLLAGVTAAVIWMSISLMTDMDRSSIGLWALIYLVAVTIITTIISTTIGAKKGAARTS